MTFNNFSMAKQMNYDAGEMSLDSTDGTYQLQEMTLTK
jgi:hypothetical protein